MATKKASVPETTPGADTPVVETVSIKPPRFGEASIQIVGISPYVGSRFSEKAKELIKQRHEKGTVQAKKERVVQPPRDFNADYEAAIHYSTAGWIGIPAPAFRNAMISACRIVGFTMTRAKLGVFVHADGQDRCDGMPLIKIKGTPRKFEATVRNDSGVCDIRVRPMFDEWSAVVRVRWDEDMFCAQDVFNLMCRCGMQVGIGEGRPDSRDSNGLGWGLFKVV
jgi:hypothetical protein